MPGNFPPGSGLDPPIDFGPNDGNDDIDDHEDVTVLFGAEFLAGSREHRVAGHYLFRQHEVIWFELRARFQETMREVRECRTLTMNPAGTNISGQNSIEDFEHLWRVYKDIRTSNSNVTMLEVDSSYYGFRTDGDRTDGDRTDGDAKKIKITLTVTVGLPTSSEDEAGESPEDDDEEDPGNVSESEEGSILEEDSGEDLGEAETDEGDSGEDLGEAETDEGDSGGDDMEEDTETDEETGP